MPGKGGGALPVDANEDELVSKINDQVRGLGESAELRIGQSMIGGAALVISRVAEEEDADLIVVATRGHTALGGLLLGSVTQRLVHVAACPVLVVPAGRPTG